MPKLPVICLLLFAVMISAYGRSSPEQYRWNLYDLLRESSLIVTAEVTMDFYMNFHQSNVFRLENGKALPDETPLPHQLYIICGHPTTGGNSPPWFLDSRYLLFLKPVSDATWAQATTAWAVTTHSPTPPDRGSVYEVVGNWKGAVDISAYRGHANQAIRRQYDITSAEIIVQSVQQALAVISNGAAFTNANALTDAFLQQFNAAPFAAIPLTDSTGFPVRDDTPR